MPRACPGAATDVPCRYSASWVGRAAQPSPGNSRCLFCDLERLEAALASPSGWHMVSRMLRASWLQTLNECLGFLLLPVTLASVREALRTLDTGVYEEAMGRVAEITPEFGAMAELVLSPPAALACRERHVDAHRDRANAASTLFRKKPSVQRGSSSASRARDRSSKVHESSGLPVASGSRAEQEKKKKKKKDMSAKEKKGASKKRRATTSSSSSSSSSSSPPSKKKRKQKANINKKEESPAPSSSSATKSKKREKKQKKYKKGELPEPGKKRESLPPASRSKEPGRRTVDTVAVLKIHRINAISADGKGVVKEDAPVDEVALVEEEETVAAAVARLMEAQGSQSDAPNWEIRAMNDDFVLREMQPDATFARDCTRVALLRKGG